MFLFPFTNNVKHVSARIILPQFSVPYQSTLYFVEYTWIRILMSIAASWLSSLRVLSRTYFQNSRMLWRAWQKVNIYLQSILKIYTQLISYMHFAQNNFRGNFPPVFIYVLVILIDTHLGSKEPYFKWVLMI